MGLLAQMAYADWFTVGIMASSSNLAINAFREIERFFQWNSLKLVESALDDEPVFLNAKQKTGLIHVSQEHGLGEGILISCQKLRMLKHKI